MYSPSSRQVHVQPAKPSKLQYQHSNIVLQGLPFHTYFIPLHYLSKPQNSKLKVSTKDLGSSNNAFVEYFNNVATRYESDTGGCTRAIGRHSLSLALPTIDESSVILDNACGPGQLTDEIISAVTYPMKIHAADASTKMIELVQDKIDKNNYTNVQAAVMDGNKLDFPDEYFTHSFTIHGIFFFPDNGAKELRRTLKKGGKAYVTTWSHQGLLPVFRAVQKCIRPHDPPYSNEMFETWNKEETLVNCLEKAGFTDIKIDRGFRAYIRQDNIEGLMRSWDFMKGGVMQGWTDEEKARWDDTCKMVLQYTGEDVGVHYDDQGRPGIPMDSYVAIASY